LLLTRIVIIVTMLLLLLLLLLLPLLLMMRLRVSLAAHNASTSQHELRLKDGG
jgi:hypothetical protein